MIMFIKNMPLIVKIVLVLSLGLNLVALWAYFHYIRYGGSPIGELKRLLTGTTHQAAPTIPYAEENAQIIKDLQAGPSSAKRVVFLGASITKRWHLDAYFTDFTPINRGVGGQLVSYNLARFKRDVLDLKPDAVVIKFCSINIRPGLPLSAISDGMEMMVQLARANGIVPIVGTIIPPAKPEAHIGDFSAIDSLKAFNVWVRDFATQNSLFLIDFAAAIENEDGFLPRQYAADPVHINEDGYELLAKVARPVIKSALGLP